MIYKNTGIQVRPNIAQPFYWDVRPFGNPHPKKAKHSDGFLGILFNESEDGLTRTVVTYWVSKDAFMATLPPEHFEEPNFSQWHTDNNMSFTWSEEFVEVLPDASSLTATAALPD